jgi:hypothetical protein
VSYTSIPVPRVGRCVGSNTAACLHTGADQLSNKSSPDGNSSMTVLHTGLYDVNAIATKCQMCVSHAGRQEMQNKHIEWSSLLVRFPSKDREYSSDGFCALQSKERAFAAHKGGRVPSAHTGRGQRRAHVLRNPARSLKSACSLHLFTRLKFSSPLLTCAPLSQRRLALET